jgi:hypothetical protein
MAYKVTTKTFDFGSGEILKTILFCLGDFCKHEECNDCHRGEFIEDFIPKEYIV